MCASRTLPRHGSDRDPVPKYEKSPGFPGLAVGYRRLLALDEFVAIDRDFLGLLYGEAGSVGGDGLDGDGDGVRALDDFVVLSLGELLGGGEVAGLGFDASEVGNLSEGEDFAFVSLEGVENGEAISVDLGFHN